MKQFVILLLAVIIFVCPQTFASEDFVGEVKKVKGEAIINHNGEQISAAVGSKIYKTDVLQTGKDSAMSFVLRDNTVLSMGPKSTLTVSKFDFEPKDRKLALLTKMMRGSASYVSGTIGKISPESVKFQTPDSTIGIRGTHFLIKVND